jgi:gag-polypeptide of LTR copia-type
MILIEWSLVDTTTTNMSSKDIASHVPMFIGQDFRTWLERMTDYLGAQRLLGYALGQRLRPVPANVAAPTQAELMAMADWDKVDLQVKSMISMQLSSNLRTLIGTTSAATWTNLHQCYGIPHFTGIYRDYELAHSIKLITGENPEVRIQKIWTILERLQANGCNLNPYLEGMLLLKAIPKEWDTIAQIYCNGMQMANVTFDGVRDAIMAEFECIARPAQLAHQADKISAVKCKGASPRFKEQRKNKSAPRSATDAPQGESSSKRTRKGGKREKARKARAAHNIVSSAFVPVTVLDCMQESHYMEAGPSTSRVEEVVEPPAPTPVTIVGGPSRALIRSAAPVSIGSIRPSGITYSRAVTLPMQSMSGSMPAKAPFNIEKEHTLLKKVGVRPTAEPLRAMHKLVEEQDETVDRVLGKHHKFMEFAKNSSPVQNAVASTSMPEKPVEPSLQDSLPPAPTFKSTMSIKGSVATGRRRPRRPNRMSTPLLWTTR